MTTIVLCNPQPQSFNHKILDAITQTLTDEGREYYVIDLYGKKFNPVLDAGQLSTPDAQARKYADVLARTRRIVFIFPIWWGEMPAMLKGFIDKAFIKGTVYDTTPEGALMPNLSIDSTMIITTSEADSELFGNYITGYLAPTVLNAVGMNGVEWHNLDHISTRTDADRRRFIADLLLPLSR